MERYAEQLERLGVHATQFPFRCSGDYMMMLPLASMVLALGFSPFGLLPPSLIRVLPQLRLETPPLWLTMHSALRRNEPIRAVWEWLGEHLPPVMQMTRESCV